MNLKSSILTDEPLGAIFIQTTTGYIMYVTCCYDQISDRSYLRKERLICSFRYSLPCWGRHGSRNVSHCVLTGSRKRCQGSTHLCFSVQEPSPRHATTHSQGEYFPINYTSLETIHPEIWFYEIINIIKLTIKTKHDRTMFLKWSSG